MPCSILPKAFSGNCKGPSSDVNSKSESLYLYHMDLKGIEKEIVFRLKQLNPERIVLFGSYGYGNPNENSDLDICVISNSPIPKSEKKRKIRHLLNGISIPKDILTPSVEEYEFYRKEIGSVYKEIDEKGKILWQSS